MTPDDLIGTRLVWEETFERYFPYRCTFGEKQLAIRLNTHSGGTLYTLVVDGIPREDLEGWPWMWTVAPVQPPVLTAELLRQWSERFCRGTWTSSLDLARVLRLIGKLRTHGNDAVIEPPPIGVREMTTSTHVGGQVVIDLAEECQLRRMDLDAQFGERTWQNERHGCEDPPGLAVDFVLSYEVSVPGAPHSCQVLAYFHDDPGPETPAYRLVLQWGG